jgi:hypothetical protein
MKAFLTIALLAGAVVRIGAQSAPQERAETTVVAGEGALQPNPFRAPEPRAQAPAARTHRWFDLQGIQAETRYRVIEASTGAITVNQWQHKQTVRAAFKFDAMGRYTIQSYLGTGNSFTGSWDPTGVGTGAPTWDFRVRRLYAQAIPVTGVEIAVGSFDVLRGQTTEIVNYDNDAYMQGYRVSLKRPHDVWLDDIAVTTGYLGNVNTPNVFKRFKWMNDHNYTQVFGEKRVGQRLAFSADWTSLEEVNTLHEGVTIGANSLGHVLDAIRLEFYQRIDSPRGNGAALTLERAVTRTLSVNGGLASVDRNHDLLTGDRYGRGKRYFAGTALTIGPELTVSAFYTHAFDNDFHVTNNQRFDLVLSYNVLKALRRYGVL